MNYTTILENIESHLDGVFLLNESNDPKRSLFGLSFEDYATWQELDRDRMYDKADPDSKWMDKIGKVVAQLKDNKREWDKFQDAFKRGNWQDYVYDVQIDAKGNWTSNKRKLTGDELSKRKKQNKDTYKFFKNK